MTQLPLGLTIHGRLVPPILGRLVPPILGVRVDSNFVGGSVACCFRDCLHGALPQGWVAIFRRSHHESGAVGCKVSRPGVADTVSGRANSEGTQHRRTL